MFPGLGGTGPGGPPSSITIPGGGGGAPQGDGPDSAGVEALVRQAQEAIRKAIPQEKDHEDALLLEKISTELQQVLANSQKLTDSAMGAGPGVKIVRKTAQAQGAGGGY